METFLEDLSHWCVEYMKNNFVVAFVNVFEF